VTYTANGNAISSMIFSVDFDETNLDFDPAATQGFPWPDAITVNPFINPFVHINIKSILNIPCCGTFTYGVVLKD